MTQPDLAALFGSAEVSTFLGLPHGAPDGPHGAGAIIGAPGATPYPSVGPYCAGAPAAIRAAMAPLAATLNHVDFDTGTPLFDGDPTVTDCGDLAFDPQDFAGNRARIRTAVSRIAEAGAVPIVIGGDDSVQIPMIEAMAVRGPQVIVQIDAHIDWRDDVGGERFGLSSTMRRASEMDHITQIVQAGMRGTGSARADDLADAHRFGARIVPARDIARDGVERVLSQIPEAADIIIALDIDGLDPTIAPGVISRAPGGIGYWQCVELIEGIARRGRLSAFGLVEYVPGRDIDDLTALTAGRLITAAIRLAAKQR